MTLTDGAWMYLDSSEQLWTDILGHHLEEARSRAASLVAAGRVTESGCVVTDTQAVRKVRFNGAQFPAYRFIYCVMTGTIASYDDVIRHRCHNRRCINPAHLTIGSRADNKHDDWEYWANGVDTDYL